MPNIEYVPVFKPMDNKISCGGFSIFGGGINNKTIDLTPMCFGVWVIDKEDAIAGNRKNVHFSCIPFLQLANLIDDSIKGDFSRFPSGGQVLSIEAIDTFLDTKVASSFGLRFEGLKASEELTPSENLLLQYWKDAKRTTSSLNFLSSICFARSTDGVSLYSIVRNKPQPSEPGQYLYIDLETNELIEQ